MSLIDITPGVAAGEGGDTQNIDGQDPAAADNADGQGQPPEDQPRKIEYNGESLDIPDQYWDKNAADGKGGINTGALLKSATDLRKLQSEQIKAPENYELAVPETLQDKITVDAELPIAKNAMEWAKANNVSQEAFSELTALFYEDQAGGLIDQDAEQEILNQALGDNPDKAKTDIGKWFGGLLGDEFAAKPELMEEAQLIASSANGVLLLKALKDKLSGHTKIPPNDGGQAGDALSLEGLKKLQASKEYQNGDKETVRKVREGYQKLYPEN